MHLCELWEGKGIYKHFAPTWDEFCLKWIEVQPQDIDRLCQGLQMLRAEGVEGPVSAAEAETRVQQAAGQTTGAALPKGQVNQYTAPLVVAQFAQPQGERAIQNGIGRRTQQKLDRLARDYPALHASVVTGGLSAHAAAKAAGFVKDPAPLTQLRRYWRQASPDERARFLADIQEGV